MNTLSAIQSTGGLDLRGLPVQKAGPTADATAIPFHELGTLGTIDPATGIQPINKGTAPGESFATTLGQIVAEVSNKQSVASEAMAGLMSGQSVTLHQAMIAMEEASVSLQLMVEVRNKLLESYQELMRMQI